MKLNWWQVVSLEADGQHSCIGTSSGVAVVVSASIQIYKIVTKYLLINQIINHVKARDPVGTNN